MNAMLSWMYVMIFNIYIRTKNIQLMVALLLAHASMATAGSQGLTLPTTPSPEDIHVATLGTADVKGFGFHREIPYFPGFDDNLQRKVPGSLFYVYQRLTNANDTFDSGIRLFDSEASAESDFTVREELDLKDGYLRINGPEAGVGAIYLERKRKVGHQTIYSSMIRWRLSTANAYVNYESVHSNLSPDRIRKLANRVNKRLRNVLDGKLKSDKIPNKLARIMPPEPIVGVIANKIGSSVASPYSWGLIDAPGTPFAMGNRLIRQGINQLGYSRYQLRDDATQVIEIVVFPFSTSNQAKQWVHGPVSRSAIPIPDIVTLSPGATGADASFILSARGGMPIAYDYKFSKGKYAANLYCYAPHAPTSTKCENYTRQLAEGWYLSLPK